MFGEALQVVEHHSLLSPDRVALVEDLSQRVQAAAEAGVEEEEVCRRNMRMDSTNCYICPFSHIAHRKQD